MQNIYDLNNNIQELESQLIEQKKKYQTELDSFLKNYFNGDIPKTLPISNNQFITVYSNNFKISKDEQNQLYWKVSGRLITVKDGQATYGHSEKELYQGEYEEFSPEFKKYTIEHAKQITKPVFKIASRYHEGGDYANYGYQLCENKELGILLIWRKGATAYINRGHSVTSESTLQIMTDHNKIDHNAKQIIFDNYLKNNIISPENQKKLNDLFFKQSRYITLCEGGRLSKKTILNNTQVINDLFGKNAVNDIITNLELHLKVKKFKKEVINQDNEENKDPIPEQKKEPTEVLVNGVKFKI